MGSSLALFATGTKCQFDSRTKIFLNGPIKILAIHDSVDPCFYMEHAKQKSFTAKKNVIVAFRLTATEAAHIDAAGDALKRPRNRHDFCRAAALHLARQRVPPPTKPIRLPPRCLPPLDIQLLSKLLAQIGKLSNEVSMLSDNAKLCGKPLSDTVLGEVMQTLTTLSTAITSVLSGHAPEEEIP
jgi:hypothetical protein